LKLFIKPLLIFTHKKSALLALFSSLPCQLLIHQFLHNLHIITLIS